MLRRRFSVHRRRGQAVVEYLMLLGITVGLGWAAVQGAREGYTEAFDKIKIVVEIPIYYGNL